MRAKRYDVGQRRAEEDHTYSKTNNVLAIIDQSLAPDISLMSRSVCVCLV